MGNRTRLHQKPDSNEGVLGSVLGLRVLSIAMGLAFAWGPLACSGTGTASARPNFILIVVDCLRADRLDFAGQGAIEFPHFDELKSKSIWFRNAHSTAAWTIPSIASILVSQLPSTHGVVKWGSKLPPEQTTMVELLQQAGYATGGWTANRLLGKSRGFSQGFDEYRVIVNPMLKPDTIPGSEFAIATAARVSTAALTWLRARQQEDSAKPFYAYLHYMEPHTPYLCADGKGDECRAEQIELTGRILKRDWNFDDSEKETIRSLYDVNVERMDAALGILMGSLQASGLLDNTWVILTADHGEQLGENGAYVHGTTLHQSVTRVPLLISPPSRERVVVDVPVSLADLAPTILSLAGVEIPDSFSGRNLSPSLAGKRLSQRPVVTELLPASPKMDPDVRHRIAVVDGDDLHLLGSDGVLQRFDLVRDPNAQHPLEASLTDFHALLTVAGVDPDTLQHAPNADTEISPEMLRHLKGLGYIE